MKWINNVLVPQPVTRLRTVNAANRTITVDGNASDWAGIAPVTDPPGDKDPGVSETGVDIAGVYLARDTENLYVLMRLHDANPIEKCMCVVEFQQFLNQLHTPGDILVIVDKQLRLPWTVRVHERGPGFDVAGPST